MPIFIILARNFILIYDAWKSDRWHFSNYVASFISDMEKGELAKLGEEKNMANIAFIDEEGQNGKVSILFVE